MKKFIVAAVIVALTGIIYGFTMSQSGRTEEYAIVNVMVKPSKLLITTSCNGKFSSKNEKAPLPGDLNPILTELSRLNEQGFEVLNMSSFYDKLGTGPGNPNFTFILVKKVN